MPEPSQRPAWYDRHLWSIQPIRDLLLLASVFGVLYIGWLISIVTVPLLLAILLAYLFEPVMKKLHARLGVSRQVASAMVIVTAAVVVLVPLLVGVGYAALQAASLARSVTNNATLLSEVVASDNEGPTTEDLPSRGGWRFLGEELLELQATAASREQLARQVEEADTIASEPEPDEDASATATQSPQEEPSLETEQA